MRALYYDCSAGIAGDMHLAAMFDLGVPLDLVKQELSKLGLDDRFELRLEPAHKMSIHGLRVNVHLTKEDHHHRHWSDIQKMIADSRLSDDVKARALAIFECIAKAEAKIHNIPVDRVHFHEVGAIDSIVDVVGAAICLSHLEVDQVWSGPVQLGSGFVKCAHGKMPVPAPAVNEILQGALCKLGGVQGEATTPTGAAILAANVDEYAPTLAFRLQTTGIGVGCHDFDIPNILRAMLVEFEVTEDAPLVSAPSNLEIKANIDDMSPEAFAPLLDGLIEIGASDAFITPIVMKKNRSAHMLTVLCAKREEAKLVEFIFNNSTTIGLRVSPVGKHRLEREIRTFDTDFGPITAKIVTQPNGELRWKPEYEEVRKAADKTGVPYLQARSKVEHTISQAMLACKE